MRNPPVWIETSLPDVGGRMPRKVTSGGLTHTVGFGTSERGWQGNDRSGEEGKNKKRTEEGGDDADEDEHDEHDGATKDATATSHPSSSCQCAGVLVFAKHAQALLFRNLPLGRELRQ